MAAMSPLIVCLLFLQRVLASSTDKLDIELDDSTGGYEIYMEGKPIVIVLQVFSMRGVGQYCR